MNASFQIFSGNGYKHASTDDIVKQAGISKGLLFHYFGTKRELYLFLYDYAVRFMSMELNAAVPEPETDFFSIFSMVEAAKLRVLKNYPYMQSFLDKAGQEGHKDVKDDIVEKKNALEQVYRTIWLRVDISRFPAGFETERLKQIVLWMEEGFMRDRAVGSGRRPEVLAREFAAYLTLLKECIYQKDAQTEPKRQDEETETEKQ